MTTRMPEGSDGDPAPEPLRYVVGIGASAGGLEALEELLRALKPTGVTAYIVAQHLAPQHESMLPALLSRATDLAVVEGEDGQELLPDRVHVVPAGSAAVVEEGVLRLRPRVESGRAQLVDNLFRSLAEVMQIQAIGVVLSGTGTDGTEGLRGIKDEGGTTYVQTPDQARFAGMPDSAVSAGVADFVMTATAIGEALVRQAAQVRAEAVEGGALDTLLDVLRDRVGVDFTGYRRTTLGRRLARRMVVRGARTLDEYLKLAEGDTPELERLRDEMLIHVTRFFRDTEVWEAAAREIIPHLLERRAKTGDPIRIWVPGCATGEEAYSLGILLLEASGAPLAPGSVQIFASDLSESAVAAARRGLYTESTLAGVSADRLRQHFVEEPGGWRVSATLREMCVFIRHDLTADPPFSRLDLISCRNLLIYFEADLQKRVVPLFHYALNAGGYLLLGRSESIGGLSNLFSEVDKPSRIYRRKDVADGPRPTLRGQIRPRSRPSDPIPAVTPVRLDLAREAERILLGRYAPAAVVVDADLSILHFVGGRFGRFLDPAPGNAKMGLLNMVSVGLRNDLRVAVEQAATSRAPAQRQGVLVANDGSLLQVIVEAVPLQDALRSRDPFYLVVIEEADGSHARRPAPPAPVAPDATRVAALEQEVANTRHYLQALTEQYEAANQELAVANEENLSANEEMQSTNEELETAKEELQSTNEELTTLNEELQNRNVDLGRTNDDLVNVLRSVDIAILMLDEGRRIRRFTPEAADALHLLPGDLGRPFSDLRISLLGADLDQMFTEVTTTGELREAEVQRPDGRWLRLQIRPYRTGNNRIEGTVLSLVDIDSLRKARVQAEAATRAKDLFLATVTHELRAPLVAILGWTQRLARGKQDPKEVHHHLEGIERNAKAASELLVDLVDLAGIVVGKLDLQREPMDLPAVVDAAVESERPAAAAKGVELSVAFDTSLPAFCGDARRIRQVVVNLLVNAIRHTPKGGRVVVRLRRREHGRIALEVEDTGSGIEPERLAALFEAEARSTAGGLGLGLTIARQMVELHGGRMGVESEGRGKGTRFWAELPTGDPTPHGADGVARGPVARQNG